MIASHRLPTNRVQYIEIDDIISYLNTVFYHGLADCLLVLDQEEDEPRSLIDLYFSEYCLGKEAITVSLPCTDVTELISYINESFEITDYVYD